MPVEMKSTIANALNDLLKQKSLDKITVKELVDACHISRQTFYYHFADIMDVVAWHQNQMLEKSIARSLAEPDCREAVRALVHETFQNKELIGQLFASQRRAEIEQMFLRSIRTYLTEMLRQKAPRLPLSPADMDAVLCFYSSGIVGLMLTNLNRREPDIDRFAEEMYKILTGELIVAFTRPA